MARGRMTRTILVVMGFAISMIPAAGAQVVFETPGLITSAGQAADVAIVRALLNMQLKLGLEYKPLAQPGDLAGMKSLIVSVGASTKGLGAAGLDMQKETARTTALVKAAKAAGVRILVMHIGGEARRGKTSNDLIQIAAPAADYIVVLAGGNKDKLFTTIGAKQNVPVVEVPKLVDAGAAVRAVFRQ